MEIIIERTYFKEACTVGFLKIKLSGEYESEFLPVSSGEVVCLCDTIEPHAIPWEKDPATGQRAEPHILGKTAIPEGTYRVILKESKTFKRTMPYIVGVPEFRSIVLRTGKSPAQTRGDILVGKLAPVTQKGSPTVIVGHPSDDPHLENSRQTFNLLYSITDEALDYGENVWLTIRSPKGWKYKVNDK